MQSLVSMVVKTANMKKDSNKKQVLGNVSKDILIWGSYINLRRIELIQHRRLI